MRNMKIEINEQQPLDEIVVELEKRGYKFFAKCSDARYAIAHQEGLYQTIMFPIALLADWPTTTLAELKEM